MRDSLEVKKMSSTKAYVRNEYSWVSVWITNINSDIDEKMNSLMNETLIMR